MSALALLDDKGQEIKTFSADEISAEAGMNRFVWDLRYPNAQELEEGSALTALENPVPMAALAPARDLPSQANCGGPSAHGVL